MAAASLVLGIISLVVGVFVGVHGWIGAILGAAGIVLAVLARKENPENGVATAGLVCSIVGLCLSAVMFLACSLLVRTVQNVASLVTGA